MSRAIQIFSLLLAFLLFGNVAIAKSSLYESQLGAKVSEVVEHQPQLKALLNFVRENGDHDVWFAGGTAVSIITYAQGLLESHAPVPKVVHWFDVFLPGQDADFAIDAPRERVAWIQESVENVIADSEHGMDIKVQDRSAWEFVTLREENGRGYVGSKKLFLQSSDTLSLGLFKLNHNLGVDIRYAPNFDEPSSHLENSFLDDIRHKRIRYLRKSTHSRSEFARSGRNPEFISVLRMINKMSRYGLSTDAESTQNMLDVVDERIGKSPKPFSNEEVYVQYRALKIARGALIGSINPEATAKLFRRFGVYELLKSAGVDENSLAELQRTESFLRQNKSPPALRARIRFPINQVFRFPDSAIVEGTTLYGGERPPTMVDRSSADYGDYINQAIEALSDRSLNLEAKAHRLSEIVNQYADDVSGGTLKSPVHYLTDSEIKCVSDCRDYSILAHMLLSELGLPATIVSTSSNTNVMVELSKRKFVLLHNGGTTNPRSFRPDYIQNVWVNAGDHVEPQPVDLPRLYLHHWLRNLDAHFNDGLEEQISKLAKFIGKRSDLQAELHAAVARLIREKNVKMVTGWPALRGLFAPDAPTDAFESASVQLFKDIYRAPTVKDRGQRLFDLLEVDSYEDDNLVRIPEDKRILTLLDEMFNGKNYRFKDNDLRSWFCQRVLSAARDWGQMPLREALFIRLLPYIDHHAKMVVTTAWVKMLEPDPKFLMIARAFDLNGKKFFYSSSPETYLKFNFAEAKELIHYDKRFALGNEGMSHASDYYYQLFKVLYQNRRMDLLSYFLQRMHDNPPSSVRSEAWFKYLAFETNESDLKLIGPDLLALASRGDSDPLNLPAEISTERFVLLSGVEALTGNQYSKSSAKAIAEATLQYQYFARLLREPETESNTAKIRTVFTSILPVMLHHEYGLSANLVFELLHGKAQLVLQIGPDLTDALIRSIPRSQLDAKDVIGTTFALFKQRHKHFPKAPFDLAVGVTPAEQKLLGAMRGYFVLGEISINDLFGAINQWFVVQMIPPMAWASLNVLKWFGTAELMQMSHDHVRQLLYSWESRSYSQVAPVLLRLKDHEYFASEAFVFNHRKFVSSMFKAYVEGAHGSGDTYLFLKHLNDAKSNDLRQVPVNAEFASLLVKRAHSVQGGTVESTVKDMRITPKARQLLTEAVANSRTALREKLKAEPASPLDAAELSRKFCQIYLRRI